MVETTRDECVGTMDTHSTGDATAPGEQEPSPAEALHCLEQQLAALQAYFTHLVSAKVDRSIYHNL